MNVSKSREIQKISRKINRLINNQSGMFLTGVFDKVTLKVDEKWEITPKIKNGIQNYFNKRLKEHTLLSYRNKQKNYLENVFESDKKTMNDLHLDVHDRLKVSNEITYKTVIFSSFKGGGAGAAGAPFTLLETYSMMNVIWGKVEIVGLIFGIEPYSYFEKVYMLYILAISLSDNREHKAEIYKKLMKLESLINKNDVKLIDQPQHINCDSVVEEVSDVILGPLVSTKLTQTIPFIGAGLGTLTSGKTVNDILHLAKLLYMRRYIQKN